MAVRVTRDWRGVKYKISECSSDELASVLANAQRTQSELERFLRLINGELVERGAGRQRPGSAAGSGWPS